MLTTEIIAKSKPRPVVWRAEIGHVIWQKPERKIKAVSYILRRKGLSAPAADRELKKLMADNFDCWSAVLSAVDHAVDESIYANQHGLTAEQAEVILKNMGITQ